MMDSFLSFLYNSWIGLDHPKVPKGTYRNGVLAGRPLIFYKGDWCLQQGKPRASYYL